MRKFFNAAIFLSISVYSIHYFYNKNEHFKNFVTEKIEQIRSFSEEDSLVINDLTKPKPKSNFQRTEKKLQLEKFYKLDLYAKNTPEKYEEDVEILAKYLIEPAKTDLEKIRILFSWVVTHVEYDDYAYNSGVYPNYSAENVLYRKKAICEGYCNLLKALCDEAGLEAEKIIGYAKGYGYKVGHKFKETNHAWNVVKIDGIWRLFDATWASGYADNLNGKLVSKERFDSFWFDVNPNAYIFSHFPEEQKWQLTNNPITLSQFEAMPFLNTAFFKLGYNAEQIYNDAVTGKVKEFLETFETNFPLNASLLPYTLNLPKNEIIKFEIHSDYAEQMAVIDGVAWHQFTKTNNVFTLNYMPKGNTLSIAQKVNDYDKEYSLILKYKIK
jgi:hypothetical protein